VVSPVRSLVSRFRRLGISTLGGVVVVPKGVFVSLLTSEERNAYKSQMYTEFGFDACPYEGFRVVFGGRSTTKKLRSLGCDAVFFVGQDVELP